MEKLRGKNQKEKSDDFKMIIKEFTRIVKKHRLSYGQTKYVIEKVRKTLHLTPAKKKAKVVNRLSQEEAQKLIHAAYQDQGKYGLLIKTLFLTGA